MFLQIPWPWLAENHFAVWSLLQAASVFDAIFFLAIGLIELFIAGTNSVKNSTETARSGRWSVGFGIFVWITGLYTVIPLFAVGAISVIWTILKGLYLASKR